MLGLFLLAVSPSAPARVAGPVVTGYVDVDFTGSAAFVRPGSTMESFGWSEHTLLPVADGKLLHQGRLDEVTGSGSIADGACNAAYTSAASPAGTGYGVRAQLNAQNRAAVTGVAPFALLRPVAHACPGGRLRRALSGASSGAFNHVFGCVLRRQAWCRQNFTVPTSPVEGGGTVAADATFYAQYIEREGLSASKMLSSYLGLLIPQLKLWSLSPTPARHVMPVVTIAPPADGTISATAALGATRLASVSGRVHAGARSTLSVTWDRVGLAAAAKLRAAAVMKVTATFTPAGGRPVTVTRTAYAV